MCLLRTVWKVQLICYWPLCSAVTGYSRLIETAKQRTKRTLGFVLHWVAREFGCGLSPKIIIVPKSGLRKILPRHLDCCKCYQWSAPVYRTQLPRLCTTWWADAADWSTAAEFSLYRLLNCGRWRSQSCLQSQRCLQTVLKSRFGLSQKNQSE